MSKILVISIPAWNNMSGSDTWTSLLKRLSVHEVANIYIDPVLPNSNIAHRYFNINESEVVKSVFTRSKETGREVESRDTSQDLSSDLKKEGKIKYLLNKSFRKPALYLREIAWKLGRWKSPALKEFLDDFHPDVVCFSIESYPYFNRINQFIIEYVPNARKIMYLWDDNFTYKQSKNILFKIERFFLRKKVSAMLNKADVVLSISQKMKKELKSELGIDSEVITKPIPGEIEYRKYLPSQPIRLLYTGKLIIGRYETLLLLAECIKVINSHKQKAILEIYTTTKLDQNKLDALNIENTSIVHGGVPQNEVVNLQKNADVLVFAESLSTTDLTARLSFSTKLTDYFAAGKCILAIGNSDLGPISYLREQNAALLASSKDEIFSIIDQIVNDPSIVEEKAFAAFECGRKNHNEEKILNRFGELILPN